MFKHINHGTRESQRGWNIYRKTEVYDHHLSEDEINAEFKDKSFNAGHSTRFKQLAPNQFEYEFTYIVDSGD